MKKSKATSLTPKRDPSNYITGSMLEMFVFGKLYKIICHDIRAGYQVEINDKLMWLSHSLVKESFRKGFAPLGGKL